MAFEHLKESLTKGNLWLYILKELKKEPATPAQLKRRVQDEHGFAPATITFYSVVYKLRHEGLVRRTSSAFRSKYELTEKGEAELAKAQDLLSRVERGLRA